VHRLCSDRPRRSGELTDGDERMRDASEGFERERSV
jgi:hypothetical protein